MNNMTDFNDLHLLAGPDAVKQCIDSAINSVADCAIDTGASGQLGIWLEPKEIKTDLPPAPEFLGAANYPNMGHDSRELVYAEEAGSLISREMRWRGAVQVSRRMTHH